MLSESKGMYNVVNQGVDQLGTLVLAATYLQ